MSCFGWLSSLEARGAKIIVAGPPCSGKNSFAELHRLAGDEILDYDVVHAELTGLPLYVHDDDQISRTIHVFGERAMAMRQGWIIQTAADPAARARAREAHTARSIVLRVWPGECHARLEASDRPDLAKMRLRPVIDEWWRRYRADHEAQTTMCLGQPLEISLTYFALNDQVPAQ